MLSCTKCGTENTLGRVFCMKCGQKLDLRDMTSDAVVEIQKRSWFSRHWPKFVWGIVAILVLMLALAFWPNTAPIGKKGSPNGGRQVQSVLRQIKNMGKGSTGTKIVDEEGINGYFETKKKDLKLLSGSIAAQERYFLLRLVKPLVNLPVAGIQVAPPFSIDLACSAPESGPLAVRKASIGHLPLMGPFKGIAIAIAGASLSKDADIPPASCISQIKIKDGKFTLTVKK